MKREESTKNQSKNQHSGGEKKPTNFRQKLHKLRNQLLATYYGNPAKDLKIICITGSTGKVTVARYVHEILKSADIHSAVLASEDTIKASVLYKFLSDAYREKATYAVVTAPAGALETDVFFGLPVAVAALTNFVPSGLDDQMTKDYLKTKQLLFKMSPEIVVLNRDDKFYEDFSSFHGTKDTLTFGQNNLSAVRIDHSKLYKMGSETNLVIGSKSFTTATFLSGQPTISYMAAAAAIATALKIAPAAITEGIANLEP